MGVELRMVDFHSALSIVCKPVILQSPKLGVARDDAKKPRMNIVLHVVSLRDINKDVIVDHLC